MAIRVLCLDIEGGHGGSSRSLFASLSHLDRDAVTPEVWCRRKGWIVDAYERREIPCLVRPDMPKTSSLPRFSRNLVAYGRYALDWMRSSDFRARLLARANEVDVVHMNHEALFGLTAWLKRHSATPVCQHLRTNLIDTPFARWQTRLLARADYRVFITANEEATYRRLGGQGPGAVIFNIADPPPSDVVPHPAVPADGRLSVACLSNYSWVRGIDRLVDVAAALAGRGRGDIRFVVAGDMRLPRSLPGRLGEIGRRGGSLADWAEERGLADMFLFLGHVPAPEQVLAACQVLIKPTREANPWGRDIIEALAAGCPVLTVGTFAEFVETGVTGVLQPEFDASALAAQLIRLADDRELCGRWGAAGQQRIARLCNGPSRAAELAGIWQMLAEGRR